MFLIPPNAFLLSLVFVADACSCMNTKTLVGGFKHEFYFFHFIYGMSFFPLTNSYFSRWLSHVTIIMVVMLVTIITAVVVLEVVIRTKMVGSIAQSAGRGSAAVIS